MIAFCACSKKDDIQPLMAPDDHFPVLFNLNERVYKLTFGAKLLSILWDFYDFPYKENM